METRQAKVGLAEISFTPLARKSQHIRGNSCGCQSSTWSGRPCFCDLFSPKMASVYLKSISVGSKSLAVLPSRPMSPSSQAKFSLHIFTHSNGGQRPHKGFRERAWLCYGPQLSFSFIENIHLDTACITSLPLLILNVDSKHAICRKHKGTSKEQELAAGDPRCPVLPVHVE